MATLKDEVNLRQERSAYFSVLTRELRRAMAKASMRTNWRLVEAFRVNLSNEEIDREINQVRTIRQRKEK